MEEKKKEETATAYGRNNRLLRLLLTGLCALGFVWALPSVTAVGTDRIWYTNSLLAFLLWTGVFVLFYRISGCSFKGKGSRWLIPGGLALLFSTCLVFGGALEGQGSVPFTQVSLWLSILALALPGALCLRRLYDWLEELTERVDAGKRPQETKASAVPMAGRGFSGKATKIVTRHSLLWRAGLIFLCYLPVFLAVYPGFFVYDAQDELMQVVTRSFSTHHPLLHVLGMGGIVQLGYKLSGSYNVGIACYTLLQMGVLSFVFSFAIGRLRKEGMKKSWGLLMTLYFGLFPTIVMFSLCSAKDGLFTGMVLVLVLCLRKLCREPAAFLAGKAHVALLVLSSLLMMLLRHNGFYAFLVFAVLLLALAGKLTRTDAAAAQVAPPGTPAASPAARTLRRKLLGVFAGIFLVYLLISQGMTLVLHADASENQELLTVPIQQLARVYQSEKDSLPQEEKQILYEILPEEVLARYTPKVSDGVKIGFQNEAYEKDPARYRKLWLKWGLSHPFTYLNAWFLTSYGFWYPDAVIDVYEGNSVFTFTYEDSSYFGFEVEQPGERASKLPLLEELYRRLSLELTQQRIPAVSMLFSPGFWFFVMMLLLGFFLYISDWRRLLPFLPALLLWLTVILGPTYLVRYVLFLWVLIPVLLWDLADTLAGNV